MLDCFCCVIGWTVRDIERGQGNLMVLWSKQRGEGTVLHRERWWETVVGTGYLTVTNCVISCTPVPPF